MQWWGLSSWLNSLYRVIYTVCTQSLVWGRQLSTRRLAKQSLCGCLWLSLTDRILAWTHPPHRQEGIAINLATDDVWFDWSSNRRDQQNEWLPDIFWRENPRDFLIVCESRQKYPFPQYSFNNLGENRKSQFCLWICDFHMSKWNVKGIEKKNCKSATYKHY